MTDLLTRLNLIERGTTKICEVERIWDQTVDFRQTRRIIEHAREAAYDYLKGQLQERSE